MEAFSDSRPLADDLVLDHGQEDSSRMLLRVVAHQTEELRELRRSMQALCEVQASSHPHVRSSQESRVRQAARVAWEEIKSYDLLSDASGNLREYSRNNPPTFKDLLSPSGDYPWNTSAYRQSYPDLANYLDRLNTVITPRLQVTCSERTEFGKLIVRESKPPLHDHASLWNHISTRFTGVPVTKNRWESTPTDTRSWSMALTRTLRVRDLDPKLAIMLMGSIPKIHVSMVAAFLDRYIAFRNWASASSWPLRHPTRNAFVFEYHIAFYSVSPTELHPDFAVRDHRGLRRSAVFGPNDDEKDRWIHEEQLSFFLVGMGKDVFTCFHLSEKYHNTPEASFAFRSENFEGPTAVFMNWLTSSFHHVAWRWHRLIDVLNNKIHTAEAIVFSAENPDLLADDPKFTKSRTYFWALQVYKMFDERLTETIDTWEKFKRERFNETNDGVLPSVHVNLGLDRITLSVEKLKSLRDLVRKKSAEVESLRQGLFGASALFDSRTSVRQGDNIRLLTYITLLFLPLSFSTSIYGMQVVLPQLPPTYFWVTLPIVLVVTGLIVFNLQDLVEMYDTAASKVTSRLRHIMRHHHREEWREMSELLKTDRAARQAPIRKIHRSTSHWDYVLFVFETVMFDLPVHEITWVWRWLRAFRQNFRTASWHEEQEGETEQKRDLLKTRAAKVLAAKHAGQLAPDPGRPNKLRKVFTKTGHFLWTLFRLVWLPLWLLVVFVEYFLVLPVSLAHPDEEFQSIGAPGSKAPKYILVLVQPFVWVGFGRQKGSRRTQTDITPERQSLEAPKTAQDEKDEALAKIVEHVAEKRRRARAARLGRRSIHGHGIRTLSGHSSQPNGRPRTGSASMVTPSSPHSVYSPIVKEFAAKGE